ncbi:MAG TPA: L-serine ammonia-lyase, partial [Chitinolyticbacter sp.]|nr:L-serine ammonia-lyase [Chitinolyticbacter sp.]
MLSAFDIFKIGVGPSSSHTVGPMLAAARFADSVRRLPVVRVAVDLYGSLALTGHGHGTVNAILNGLEGCQPASCNPQAVVARGEALQAGTTLLLHGDHPIGFDCARDLQLHRHEFLKLHANGLRFRAWDAAGAQLAAERYYSIGGGFVVSEAEFGQPLPEAAAVPYPFRSAAELLGHCRAASKTIAEIAWANECALQHPVAVRKGLIDIAHAMHDCIEAGCRHEGVLPGGYAVRRRAPGIFRKLVALQLAGRHDIMLWPMLYAMAVNEENAAGGRVVTAPTNGAAGIVPAVLQYWRNFDARASEQGMI